MWHLNPSSAFFLCVMNKGKTGSTNRKLIFFTDYEIYFIALRSLHQLLMLKFQKTAYILKHSSGDHLQESSEAMKTIFKCEFLKVLQMMKGIKFLQIHKSGKIRDLVISHTDSGRSDHWAAPGPEVEGVLLPPQGHFRAISPPVGLLTPVHPLLLLGTVIYGPHRSPLPSLKNDLPSSSLSSLPPLPKHPAQGLPFHTRLPACGAPLPPPRHLVPLSSLALVSAPFASASSLCEEPQPPSLSILSLDDLMVPRLYIPSIC